MAEMQIWFQRNKYLATPIPCRVLVEDPKSHKDRAEIPVLRYHNKKQTSIDTMEVLKVNIFPLSAFLEARKFTPRHNNETSKKWNLRILTRLQVERAGMMNSKKLPCFVE